MTGLLDRALEMLSPLDRETLELLWTVTWDGDLPSKASRTKLVELGFVQRGGNGYQWLTNEGVILVTKIKVDRGDGDPPHWRKHLERYLDPKANAARAAGRPHEAKADSNISDDFEELRAAVSTCLKGGPRMHESVERSSGSVNGGTIVAARWWWILRGAMEKTWARHGKFIKSTEVWEP